MIFSCIGDFIMKKIDIQYLHVYDIFSVIVLN